MTILLSYSHLGLIVSQLACGGYHTFIVGELQGRKHLYACGFNAHGRLGLGTTTNEPLLTLVPNLPDAQTPAFVSVSSITSRPQLSERHTPIFTLPPMNLSALKWIAGIMWFQTHLGGE